MYLAYLVLTWLEKEERCWISDKQALSVISVQKKSYSLLRLTVCEKYTTWFITFMYVLRFSAHKAKTFLFAVGEGAGGVIWTMLGA